MAIVLSIKSLVCQSLALGHWPCSDPPSIGSATEGSLPVVINTWAYHRFALAADAAWRMVENPGSSRLDVVVAGCSSCEKNQCGKTVGYGNNPDSAGRVTLDAMVMDGEDMKVGAVAGLRGARNAVGVARAVLEHTTHTLLVGEGAAEFAAHMGFEIEGTETDRSTELYRKWRSNNCQPNFYRQVTNIHSCGPHNPTSEVMQHSPSTTVDLDETDYPEPAHDTIALLYVDVDGKVACGTSTNGLRHKVSGRVGDTPIPGSGCYAESGVGAAGATGDGDILMRFLPTFRAIEEMKRGASPTEACERALDPILAVYPKAFAALVCVNTKGEIGAAGRNVPHGSFPFSYRNVNTGRTVIAENRRWIKTLDRTEHGSILHIEATAN